jgi:hypothetical protein
LADFVEIQIEAGATFFTEITVNDANGNPKDLTEYTVRSQLRKSYYSLSAVDFDMEITDPLNGIVEMGLSAAITTTIRAGRYVYDVEIEDTNGIVTRIFEGIVTVLPNVTKNINVAPPVPMICPITFDSTVHNFDSSIITFDNLSGNN